MRATTALFRIAKKSLPEDMHARRRATLTEAIAAAVAGESLTLTGIGRALRSVGGRTSVKHEIKRADRLLGNAALQAEAPDVYRQLASQLLRGVDRPTILIDWTPLDRNRVHALVASVPIDGRAQIVYSRTVPLRLSASPRVQAEFLSELAKVLPAKCRPIIVTDAGFKTSWCDAVAALGWDFVTRVRGTTTCSVDGESWQAAKTLYASAGGRAQDLGTVELTHKNVRSVRLVLSKKPRRTKTKNIARGRRALKQAKANTEPLLLSTSLSQHSAEAVVQLYGKRMQIEETFRDTKCARFGFSLSNARGRAERLNVLILIAALATLALLLIGISAERHTVHHAFQANTLRTKRVLSLVRLGLEVWRSDHRILFGSLRKTMGSPMAATE